MTGRQYEFKCKQYLLANGYQSVRLTPVSGDQGVDLIAEKNGDRYAFQCKYYSKSGGNKAVQEVFAGAKYYGCSKAFVITNSYLTSSARELARRLDVGVIRYDGSIIEPKEEKNEEHKNIKKEINNYNSDYSSKK